MLTAKKFWTRVKKTRGCWIWTGPRLLAGYGNVWIDNERKTLAHRYSWELKHGPIPRGLHVCHHCDNPPCVRPSHLFIGTVRDNMRDCSRKGRLGGTFQPGEKAPNVKLTQSNVNKIRTLRGKFMQSELAVMFGVTEKTICRIQTGESWKHSL